MREAASKIAAAGGKVIGFSCIVDRSGGAFASGISSGPNGESLPLWSAFQTDME
jgi:orotate phosphoribosyltransferase